MMITFLKKDSSWCWLPPYFKMIGLQFRVPVSIKSHELNSNSPIWTVLWNHCKPKMGQKAR